MRTALSCSLLVFALLAAGCTTSQFLLANAPTRFDRVDAHVDLHYGTDPRQSLDIYAPPQARNRPVVIFWYGGSWMKGSKSDYRFVGTTLAEHGFLAVIADYRLYPQVRFPSFDEDGARAVAWVEQHAREYGGDPQNIVLMGHSAGGHTAAFLAYNSEFLRKFGAEPRFISGLVGLSGTYVFEPDTNELRAVFRPPYTNADWQPIRFVSESAPPTLLLHGLNDKEVLPQEALDLQGALERSHVRVELHLYPHRGHGDTVAPFAPLVRWRTPVVQQTVRFIESVTSTSGPRASTLPALADPRETTLWFPQ